MAWLLVAVATAAAQITSSLRGHVTDSSGAAIVGAQVALQNAATGFLISCRTDAQGEYRFYQIPSGAYTVLVTAGGFAAQSTTEELLVDQPATADFSLSVQSLRTVVQVSGETQELNLVDASIGNAVNTETIQALPMNSRNVPDLLSLQPGVLYLGHQDNQSYDSRSGASAGGRSDQGNITLDGVDNNDQVDGYAFAGVLRSTLDSVQEFRVTTGDYGAESGRSSGAQVSVLTRSGTNRVRGSLYEYNRSSVGEANDWFNKQAELSNGRPNVPGKLIRNTFGISLGGPIKKDRAFFFFNYEGQRTQENLQQTLIVPTASMRAGNIEYTAAGTNATVDLSPAQIAVMDPKCTANGTCPWGPGVDPYALAVLNQYPAANSTSAGDGLNTASYTWSAPDPAALNTYIARFDSNLSQRNWIFVRGVLQNDKSYSVPQFPGDPASATVWNNSKGIAVGDTWNISANLINNLRYGLTRMGVASRGIGQGQYANFYNISPLDAETRTTIVDVPVHNIVDDLTFTHNEHTIQCGINYRLIHDHRTSDALSYDYGYTNAYALAGAGIANTGQSLDPAAFGYPAVAGSFTDSYSFAMANLAGLLDLVTTEANYQIHGNGNSASLLPEGSMVDREFKNNEFEYYVQDIWRVRPRLTVTFGLRHTLLQTPYEIHGQQVQPTVDMDQWFRTRGQQALLGNSVQPDLYFAPSGQSRGRKPYWPMQKGNVAPRVSFAFAPSPRSGFWRILFGGADKSSIRAGYGIYYDHFGEGIVNLFDQYGSFGLNESITNPTNLLTPDTSPRFTGIHSLPNITGAPATTISYPDLAPNNPLWTGFEISHGLDDRMKTPYAQEVDFSIARDLPRSFTLEVTYMGRFGRHQLQQIDMAEPLDLVDPKSGQDYYTAATELSKLHYEGVPVASVKPVAYFEDMFPDAAENGASATQNIYNIWLPGNETGSLYMLDILCTPGCGGQTNRFWPRQYASLYAWSSMGNSSYNALQVNLLRRETRNFQMELAYTYSKSLDMGSDTERTMYSSSTGTSAGSSFDAILNAWKPRLNYAVSDFDVRHLIAADWVSQLPFGQGRALFAGMSRAMNTAFGGWQFSGVARWTSGLPFSVICGTGWGTDWVEKSNMIQTGPIKTHTHLDSNGNPEVFASPAQALANMRNPYPGEAGQRNNFRGDGYFDVDASLSKVWQVREGSGFKFAWEVFNVFNSVRFDVNPITSLQNMTTSGEFGIYGATLTRPRVQQFSLRYMF
ncbi:MAG: carboxypeptidase regulatory-like domain-containing protein [Terracidiphilus sp.]